MFDIYDYNELSEQFEMMFRDIEPKEAVFVSVSTVCLVFMYIIYFFS